MLPRAIADNTIPHLKHFHGDIHVIPQVVSHHEINWLLYFGLQGRSWSWGGDGGLLVIERNCDTAREGRGQFNYTTG